MVGQHSDTDIDFLRRVGIGTTWYHCATFQTTYGNYDDIPLKVICHGTATKGGLRSSYPI